MAKTDRCPICGVAVKAENLLRHLNDTHPRHPDTSGLREQLKADGRTSVSARRSATPIHVRGWHVGVVLAIGTIVLVAVVVAPYLDPNRNFSVDSCINEFGVTYHIHVRLSIAIQGSLIPIPVDTGITSTCTKSIHTHADYDPNTEPAIIHVESPVARSFVLADFFHVWGQPFSETRVLTCTADGTNVVRMTVTGAQSTAYGALVLADGQQIAITCGP